MRTPQEILADLTASGLTAAQMALVVELVMASSAAGPRSDDVTERRRAADRARKSNARLPDCCPQMSAVSADIPRNSADTPSSLSSLLTSLPNNIEVQVSKEERKPAREGISADIGGQSDNLKLSHFEAWWDSWPNKVGKREAAKAFPKALKKIDIERLMDATSRYAAKTDDRAWMNPATFLNGERWNDQPSTTMNGNIHGRQKDGQPSIQSIIRAHQEQLTREREAQEAQDRDDQPPAFSNVCRLPYS